MPDTPEKYRSSDNFFLSQKLTPTMTSRSWCFTVNNWTEDDLKVLEALGADPARCRRLLVARETAPTTGTKHLQCAVTLVNSVRLSQVRLILEKAHWEPMKARDEAAWTYCKKEGDVVIDINRICQGRRTDRESAYAAVKRGIDLKTYVREEEPGLPGIELFKKARLILADTPKWRQLTVTAVYGPPGSGKSRWAHAQVCADSRDPWVVVKKPSGGICWDSYDGQDTIIFDDYRPDFCDFDELLRILDGYRFELHSRYTNGTAQWTKVIFTSVVPIMDMWAKKTEEDLAQLKRRVTNVVTVTEVWGNTSPDF